MEIKFTHDFENGIYISGYFNPDKLMGTLEVPAINLFDGEKGIALIEKSSNLQNCIETKSGYLTIKPYVRAFIQKL